MNPKLYCFQCMGLLDAEDQLCPYCGYDNRVRVNARGNLPYSIVKDRYIIGKTLGRGGFGVTYIGLDLSLNRRVAIKEYMPKELVSRSENESALMPYDDVSRTQFERGRERSLLEARTIARLNDVPDTVNVYDVFIANNTLYIVMEYIKGETLRARVQREGGRIAPQPLMDLLRPIFVALPQIHAQGIIHRDINPDNMMLRQTNGRAVLLDFGAANDYSSDIESVHSVNVRHGYAPKEQYSRTGRQDARTDEYALCATLYFALTGETPVPSQERAYGDEVLKTPSELGVALPPDFEAALLKGLSIQAKDRFEDIPTLVSALDKALGTAHEEPVTPPSSKVEASTETHKSENQSSINSTMGDNREPTHEDYGVTLTYEQLIAEEKMKAAQTEAAQTVKATESTSTEPAHTDTAPESPKKESESGEVKQAPAEPAGPAPRKRHKALHIIATVLLGLTVLFFAAVQVNRSTPYWGMAIAYMFAYLLPLGLILNRHRKTRKQGDEPLTSGYLLRLLPTMAVCAIALWLWFVWTVTRFTSIWAMLPFVASYGVGAFAVYHKPRAPKARTMGRSQAILWMLALMLLTVSGYVFLGKQLQIMRALFTVCAYLFSPWILAARINSVPVRGKRHILYLAAMLWMQAGILLIASTSWDAGVTATALSMIVALLISFWVSATPHKNHPVKTVLRSVALLLVTAAFLYLCGTVYHNEYLPLTFSSSSPDERHYNIFTFEHYLDGVALTGYCLPTAYLRLPETYNGKRVLYVTDNLFSKMYENASSSLAQQIAPLISIRLSDHLYDMDVEAFDGYEAVEIITPQFSDLQFANHDYQFLKLAQEDIQKSVNNQMIDYDTLPGIIGTELVALYDLKPYTQDEKGNYNIVPDIEHICYGAYVPNGNESTDITNVTFPNLKEIAPYGLNHLHVYNLTLPENVNLEKFSLLGVTVDDTVTIGDGSTVVADAFLGLNTSKLVISDNVTLNELSDNWTRLTTETINDTGFVSDRIIIGKNVNVKEGALGISNFSGTLELVKGATLPSLDNLFGFTIEMWGRKVANGNGDYSYTLVCDKGAILDGVIPENVKVKYRK